MKMNILKASKELIDSGEAMLVVKACNTDYD